MTSDFNSKFVEDNFLSDDDWAARHLHATLGMEDSPDYPDNVDTESLLTNWSSGSSAQSPTVYIEHENDINTIHDFDVNDLLTYVESPPLTPPDDNIDIEELLKSSASLPASDVDVIHSCNELILPVETVSSNTAVPSQMSLVRDRSNSNESSTTSAYSSQSATPPPKTKADDASDNLFFSNTACTLQNPSDEGFHDAPRALCNYSVPRRTNCVENGKNNLHSNKMRSTQQKQRASFQEEMDFDKKVEEALKETNRLLNMHKMKLCEPNISDQKLPRSNTHMQNGTKPSVDLRQLCDSTILQTSSSVKANSKVHKKQTRKKVANQAKAKPSTETIVKELKRKAIEKQKNEIQSQTSSAAPIIVANLNSPNPITVSTQSQVPIANVLQAPVTSCLPSTEPPVKIIVKQEPLSQVYLSTTTNNNATTLTIVRTGAQNQVTAAPCNNSFAKKPEIPLHSLVIKPEKPTTNVLPSSNNPTNGPPVKQSGQKPASKPLMVSQPPKKPIVPNGNAIYPSTILQASLSVPSARETSCRNQPESVPLASMDEETQNRVLKRQQRMIKNREWACQSRQRRKEYITTLEQRMNACMEDNDKLRNINSQLTERIYQLEKENATLRALAGQSRSAQKKAACLLMLVMFIGFNVNPMSFLSFNSPSEVKNLHNFVGNDSRSTRNVPVETSYHGRQLLAVVEKEGEGDKSSDVTLERNESKSIRFNKVQRKPEYWVDDMVESYKKEHINRILEILQVTAPGSLQRLLRRKLKEELGIRLPLPNNRHRRISYTPALSSNRRGPLKKQNPVPAASKPKLPPPPPSIEGSTTETSPCDTLEKSFNERNESDALRVNDHLAKWIEQHEVDRTNENKVKETEVGKKVQNSKRRRARSESLKRNISKSSVPAVYEKREKKLKRLLESIERRNDTVYMISFSKDHILLPASVFDGSGHTKMSLILPTVPPNDSFVNMNQAAMIQINCEVHSTNYVRIDRELLAGVGHTASQPGQGTYSKHDHGNPKRKAFHGSKSTIVTHLESSKKNPASEKLINQDDDATVSDVDL